MKNRNKSPSIQPCKLYKLNRRFFFTVQGRMIYGLILVGHNKVSSQIQRANIIGFATNKHLVIDEFISFKNVPDLSKFKSGDTIICYAWNCLCQTRSFLRTFIQYLLKNNIYLYSTTSNYYIDNLSDVKKFEYAFGLYEDIRFNFLSNKNSVGAITRVKNGHEPGRKTGSKNIKHLLDGKEQTVIQMYNDGISMYAIAKKLNVSAPTIKRFLVAQN